MVFEKMLRGFTETAPRLQALFSRNFMSCLLNQASKEDRYLHRAATKALKAIEEVVVSHPDTLAPILANLLGKNGSYAFDQRSNSKTVDKLLQNINKQNVEDVLAVVKRPIKLMKKKEDVEAQATVRTYSDYLAKILNAFASAPSENDRPGSQPEKVGEKEITEAGAARGSFVKTLQELTNVAYGQPAEIPRDALTDQIREMCRSRLETSLAKLARASTDFAVFCKAVASIDSSAMNMTPEIEKAKDAALVRMGKLLKSKSDAAQGLAMLHAISIFQLYNEDPDAMDVLDDLSQCYDKLRSGNTASERSGGGSELLVEILLSLVARPSSLMRQVSQQVFGVFTSQMSAESVELLTGPLASGESTKGQKELFNTEDDEMEIDSDASEGDDDDDGVIDVEDAASDFEIDSDLEFVELNGDEESDGRKAEDDGDEESEDQDDDDDDDGDEDSADGGNGESEGKLNQKGEWDNPEELDDILGSILNSHRLDKDAEAESSEDEGDMSDSQMFALEEQLSAAIAPRIKANKNDTKKQKKDAKQSVVNFKHRILDLLDIYVKNEALNPLTFSILLPLLILMRTTSTKALANRAYEVILNLRKAIKKARANVRAGTTTGTATSPAAEDLLPLLLECHDEAGKDDSQAYAKAASTASLIVASTMFRRDRESIERIAAVYAKTESAWVLNKVRMHTSFFKDWHDWAQSMRSTS